MEQPLLYAYSTRITQYHFLLIRKSTLAVTCAKFTQLFYTCLLQRKIPATTCQQQKSFYGSYTSLFLLILFSLYSGSVLGQYKVDWETQSFKSNLSTYEGFKDQIVDSKGNLIILGFNGPAWERSNIPDDSYEGWGGNHAAYTDGTGITLYKYSADGKLLWSKVLSGGSKYDAPGKLLLDRSDNIYVSGYDGAGGSFIAKYATGGQELWKRSGTDLGGTTIKDFVLDASGTVYLVGTSQGFMSTQKLSPEGVVQWASEFAGSDGEGAQAFTIAFDNQGAVYTATKLTVPNPCNCGAMGWDNITLVKYDAANGSKLYHKDYEYEKVIYPQQAGPSDFKYPAAIIPTPSESVYLLVNQHDGMYGHQAVIFKLNGSGEIIWSRTANNTSVTSLKKAYLSDNESLVLLCRENTYRDFDEFFITKINKDGQKIWNRFPNYTEEGRTRRYLLRELYVSNTNVSITGATDSLTIYNGFPPATEEYEKMTSFIKVYDLNGNAVWEKRGSIDGSKMYYGSGISQSGGSLYAVTGERSDTGSKLIATRYSPGSAAVPEAWVSQTHIYDKSAGTITVNWKLNISEAQPAITKYNVYHSSTDNGALQNWVWDVPASQTSVSGAYVYPVSKMGNTEFLVMGLATGTGYTVPNTAERPREVKIRIEEVTGGAAPTITTNALAANRACAGATISVPFKTEGNFSAGNTFTAQLSNASGSFASPVAIGTGTASPISATIPTVTAPGAGYRIRIIASSPATIGTDNGSNLSISTAPARPGAISGTTSVCAGAENLIYSIDAVAGATNYTWTASGFDIIEGQGTRSIKLRAGNTSGTIRVVANNDCGSSVASELAVTVVQKPAATITTEGATSLCQGGSVILKASTGSGYTYQWLKDGAVINGATAATYAVNNTGSYSARVTNSTGCTATSAATSVEVNTPFTVNAGDNQSVCASASAFNLTGFSPAGGTWSGTGVTAGGSFNPATAGAGSHTLSYTVTKDNCTVTGTKIINVLPAVNKPGAIAGSTTLCAGAENITYTIDAVEGAAEYIWTATGLTILSGQGTRSVVVRAGTGNGSLRVVAKNNCGTSQASEKAISVTKLPEVAIQAGSATTVCAGGAVDLSVNAGSSYSYQWLKDGHPVSGATAATYAATTAGQYSVTVSSGNCSVTAPAITVSVGTAVSGNTISQEQTLCTGQAAAKLVGGTPAGGNGSFSYQWEKSSNGTDFSLVDGATAKDYQPQNLTASTWFRRKVTSGSCTHTSPSVKITVNPVPSVSLSVFETMCDNAEAITLTGGMPAGGTYTGNGVSNGMFDPKVAGPGTHTITYTYADGNNCGASATQTIVVKTDCGVTGVEDKEPKYKLLIFPNPTSSVVNMHLYLEKRTDLMVRLVDARGRIIEAHQFKAVQGELKKVLNLEKIATGMYLVQFITEEGVKTRRIVVH